MSSSLAPKAKGAKRGPKGPSAYLKFCEVMRSKIYEYELMKDQAMPQHVMRICGRKWRALDNEIKEKLKEGDAVELLKDYAVTEWDLMLERDDEDIARKKQDAKKEKEEEAK